MKADRCLLQVSVSTLFQAVISSYYKDVELYVILSALWDLSSTKDAKLRTIYVHRVFLKIMN